MHLILVIEHRPQIWILVGRCRESAFAATAIRPQNVGRPPLRPGWFQVRVPVREASAMREREKLQ